MDKQILDTLIQIKNVLERSTRSFQQQSPHEQSGRAANAMPPSQKQNLKNSINTEKTISALSTLTKKSLFAATATRSLGVNADTASSSVSGLGTAASVTSKLMAQANARLHSSIVDSTSILNSAVLESAQSVKSAVDVIAQSFKSFSTNDLQDQVNAAAAAIKELKAQSGVSSVFERSSSSLSQVSAAADNAASNLELLAKVFASTKTLLDNLPGSVDKIQQTVEDFSVASKRSSDKLHAGVKVFTKGLGTTIDTVNSVNVALGETKTKLESINSAASLPSPSSHSNEREILENTRRERGFIEKRNRYFDEFLTHFQQNSFSLQATLNRTMIKQVSMIGHHIKTLADTVFTSMMPRGFDIGPSSVISLGVNAAKAGLSLREYTKMIEDSSGVVSRVGGIEGFNKALQDSNKKLQGLGIFGEDASRLSQSILTSSQAMGVPVDQLGNAVAGQVKVFEKLRKTTNMSSEGFEELRRTVMDSEVTQSELLALAPSERAARQTELMELASWGAALGMSRSQTAQLAQSMMELRKSTVKQRQEDSMRIAQAFSMVGMSASQAAEAAAIRRKSKPTTEEQERLTELMGLYKQRSQQFKDSNDPMLQGLVVGIEGIEEKFSGSLQKITDEGGKVVAQKESGNQTENDTKKPNSQASFFAQILTAIEGFLKNDVAKIGVGIALLAAKSAVSLATTIAQLRYLKAIAANTGGAGAGDKPGFFERWTKKSKTTKDKDGKPVPDKKDSLLKKILGGSSNCCCCCCDGSGAPGSGASDIDLPDVEGKNKKGPAWKRKLKIVGRRISRAGSRFASSAMELGSNVIEKVKNPRATIGAVADKVKGFSFGDVFKSTVDKVKGFRPSAAITGAADIGKGVIGSSLKGIASFGKAASSVVKRLPLIGNLLSVGFAASDYMDADEQAKERGISSEERKGEIIGGAASNIAGAAAGGALLGPIGAVAGSMIGEWLGTHLGGYIGSNFESWFGEDSMIGKAVSGASKIASDVASYASAAVSTGVTKISELGTTIGSAVSTWASSATSAMGGWLSTAGTTMADQFKGWFGEGTVIGGVIKSASSIATSVIDTGKSLANDVSTWIGNSTIISDAMKTASSITSSVIDTGKSLADDFASWFSKDSSLGRAITGASGLVSSTFDKAKGFFSSNTDAVIKNTSAIAKSSIVSQGDLSSLTTDVRATAQAYSKAPEAKPATTPTADVKPTTTSTTPVQATPAQGTPTSIQAAPIQPATKSVNQQVVNTGTTLQADGKPKPEIAKDQTIKLDSGVETLGVKDMLQLIADLLKKTNETELAQLEALLAMARSSGKSLALMNNQDLTKMLNA